MSPDPTRRFSSRVQDYVAARPGYPIGVRDTLVRECGLGPGKAVADVGSGTGLLTRDLLESGATVYAVEPNAAMRQAADEALAGAADGRLRSIEGSAEATRLQDASVDLVVAAQAFHWFDRTLAREEFSRILREPRWVALIWNERLESGTPFLEGYERLLREYGVDYLQVRHRAIAREDLQEWFGGDMRVATFANAQRFDFEGIRRRMLSSSYVPQVGHPGHDAIVDAFRELVAETSEDGTVELRYETNVFFGTLR